MMYFSLSILYVIFIFRWPYFGTIEAITGHQKTRVYQCQLYWWLSEVQSLHCHSGNTRAQGGVAMSLYLYKEQKMGDFYKIKPDFYGKFFACRAQCRTPCLTWLVGWCGSRRWGWWWWSPTSWSRARRSAPSTGRRAAGRCTAWCLSLSWRRLSRYITSWGPLIISLSTNWSSHLQIWW